MRWNRTLKIGHLLLVGLGVLALSVLCQADSTELEYRAVALVRDFGAPGLDPESGALAAEAISAALERRGLVRTVRPKYATMKTWEQPVENIKLDDLRQDSQGAWQMRALDIFGLPIEREGRIELYVPDSEFIVEGTAALLGETWWIRATLADRATGMQLASADALGKKDKGLVQAARKAAEQLEAPLINRVLERRVEAIRRALHIAEMNTSDALRRLQEMDDRWPGTLAPAALGLLLVSGRNGADPEQVIAWGKKVVERIPQAGPENKRLLMRLGIKDPYEMLAGAYEAKGMFSEAAEVRRRGALERSGTQ